MLARSQHYETMRLLRENGPSWKFKRALCRARGWTTVEWYHNWQHGTLASEVAAAFNEVYL